MEKCMSVREVAELMGVSEGTIYRLANKKGGIKAYKVGGCIRFKPSDVNAYLEAREIKPPEKSAKPFSGMTRFKYTPGMRVV